MTTTFSWETNFICSQLGKFRLQRHFHWKLWWNALRREIQNKKINRRPASFAGDKQVIIYIAGRARLTLSNFMPQGNAEKNRPFAGFSSWWRSRRGKKGLMAWLSSQVTFSCPKLHLRMQHQRFKAVGEETKSLDNPASIKTFKTSSFQQ